MLDTYGLAERYGDPQVLYRCLRLIDRHARFVLGSPAFVALPSARLARLVLYRRTLRAREVEAFEAAVRWTQAELGRRMQDGAEGAVPSAAQIFREDFGGCVRFDRLSSEVSDNYTINLLTIGYTTRTDSRMCLYFFCSK